MTISEVDGSRYLDPPRFFITEIFTGNDFSEDIAIITLPYTTYSSDGEELASLTSRHLNSGIGSQVDIADAGPITLDSLGHLISGVVIGAPVIIHEMNLAYTPSEHLTRLVDHVLFDVELPIQNSPITGTHLANLFSIGGPTAYLAATAHLGLRQVAIYFLMVGGTRVVLGASTGISEALQHGLRHVLLSWMNVPEHLIEKKSANVRAQSRSS